MRQVRNAMTAARSGGALAASNVRDGGDGGTARETDFGSLLGVEERGAQANQRSESEIGIEEERESSRRCETDEALANLAGRERRLAGTSLLGENGRMERTSDGHDVSNQSAAQGADARATGDVAKSGKPVAPSGGAAVRTRPDSFASSIRSGAFRGQTSSGGKGVRAWVQAWLNSTSAANQSAGVTPGAATAGGIGDFVAMADASGPLPLGEYLRGAGRIRGEHPGRADRRGRGNAGPSSVGSGQAQESGATAAGPRSWAEILRTQGKPDAPPPTAAGEGNPAAPAPAVATPTPQPGEAFTLAPGAPAPAAATPGAATTATAARAAQAPLTAGDGFAMTDPGATENGVRIRIPTATGETVRGRMYVDSDTRAVRVVLAVQEGDTAQSMSSAHEMLRVRLADEGYQLQSFIVRHDGRSVARFEDELPAQFASDGGRDADTADPRDGNESRSRNGRGRNPQERAASAVRTEEPVASGWFL